LHSGRVRGWKTPKKGYKSITVKTEVYDYFFTEWLKVKDEYAIKKASTASQRT